MPDNENILNNLPGTVQDGARALGLHGLVPEFRLVLAHAFRQGETCPVWWWQNRPFSSRLPSSPVKVTLLAKERHLVCGQLVRAVWSSACLQILQSGCVLRAGVICLVTDKEIDEHVGASGSLPQLERSKCCTMLLRHSNPGAALLKYHRRGNTSIDRCTSSKAYPLNSTHSLFQRYCRACDTPHCKGDCQLPI
eukprot:2274733-Amphidinium_carterae.1